MFHISNYFHNYEYKTRGIILLNEKDQFVSWQNVQSTVYQNIYFQRSFPSKPRVFVWTCISGRWCICLERRSSSNKIFKISLPVVNTFKK